MISWRVIFILFFVGTSINMSSLVQAESSSKFKTHLVKHNDVQRTYHVYLPKGFKSRQNLPLIIALHGGGGQALKWAQSTDNGSLIRAADKYKFVAVFPEGINRQWNDGRWEIFGSRKKWKQAPDDVDFISTIIDRLVKDYKIDSNRVFATGISNGGFMSIRLALELSDRLRAVAPVTAQLSRSLRGKKPDQPISIMIINGTEDPLVPYEGGDIRLFRFGRSRGAILPTERTIQLFSEFNGCRDTPKINMLEDLDPNDQTRVLKEQYEKCHANTKVVLIKVIGGGHTWPGGKQYLPVRRVGRVARDIDATEMIVDFFLSQ